MEIFIVEDNENVREALAVYLKLEGFTVHEFASIDPADRELVRVTPDILILDVMLPDGDGFLFAKRLKTVKEIPIIFLTARDQESDRITGLEIGADDYVVKPFSPREVVLRVKAVLKRAGKTDQANTAAPCYSLGESSLCLYFTSYRAELDGTPLTLTAAEWSILTYLVRHAPQVFSRLQLLESCLDSVAEGSERTIDTHIKNIRRKLSNEQWIVTVRGFGYRFNGEA